MSGHHHHHHHTYSYHTSSSHSHFGYADSDTDDTMNDMYYYTGASPANQMPFPGPYDGYAGSVAGQGSSQWAGQQSYEGSSDSRDDRDDLVRIAIRKRPSRRGQSSAGSREMLSGRGREGKKKKQKLGRPLDPKTRINLTVAPNLVALHSFFGRSYRTDHFEVFQPGSLSPREVEMETDTSKTLKLSAAKHGEGSQMVVLVDSEYRASETERSLGTSADRHKFPSAVGFEKGDSRGSSHKHVPIYNSFELAAREIFGLREFSLVRVTRASAQEDIQCAVIKLETAHPGDIQLNDIDEKVDERSTDDEDLEALGRPGDPVSPMFIKKKIARPRYKANMRIYLLPRDTEVVLYTHRSMLKRDIMKGVIDMRRDPRLVFSSFDYKSVLKELNIY